MDTSDFNSAQNVIQATFSPVLLVIATKGAHALCAEYGSSVLQLLHPTAFSSLRRRLRFQCKTAAAQQYGELPSVRDMRNLSVRFVSLETLQSPDGAKLANVLEKAASAPAPPVVPASADADGGGGGGGGGGAPSVSFAMSNRKGHIPVEPYVRFGFTSGADVPAYVEENKKREISPWFSRFRWTYINALGCNDHEYFNHPLACILVGSADEGGALVRNLAELYNEQQPPLLFGENNVEPKLIKHYVVLHRHNQKDDADARLKELQTAVVANGDGAAEHCARIPLTRNESGGLPLTSNTFAVLDKFVHLLIVNHVLVKVDMQSRVLYELIDSKKGLKSQVKSWFGMRKNKDDAGADGGAGEQKGKLGESCRRMGDLLFMLKDPGVALQFYEYASKEFKQEKLWKHYAGAQEMIGCCNYLCDGSSSQSAFDNAYSNYTKQGSRRLALRGALIHAAVLMSRGQWADTCAVYSKVAASADDPAVAAAAAAGGGGDEAMDDFVAALLQEQAAFTYLRLPVPMFRKFVFNLIMAGLRFANANKVMHALRCYEAAFRVYDEQHWSQINDFLHYSMSRLCYLTQNTGVASLVFSQRLLHNNSQSAAKQGSFLRQFLHIVATLERANAGEIYDIPVPVIDHKTIAIIVRDGGEDGDANVNSHALAGGDGGGGGATQESSSAQWGVLKSNILKCVRGQSDFELLRLAAAHKIGSATDAAPAPIAVLKETVFVEFMVRNPLNIPLDLTGIQLLAEFDPVGDGNGDDGDGDDKAFEAYTQSVIIKPLATVKFKLQFMPLREGFLRITGIGFCLFNSVWGKSLFSDKHPLAPIVDALPRSKDKRDPEALARAAAAARQSMAALPVVHLPSMKVTPQMPLLETRLVGWSDRLLHGEMKPFKIRFTNCGSIPLKRLVMSTTSEEYFHIGLPVEKPPVNPHAGSGSQTPSSPGGNGNSGGKGGGGGSSGGSSSGGTARSPTVFSVPLPPGQSSAAVNSLQPGGSLEAPLLVRGAHVGTHHISMLFYYESDEKQRVRYRLHRMSVTLIVEPSMSASVVVRASDVDVQSHIVTIAINNLSLREHVSFRWCRVSVVGRDHDLESLHDANERENVEVSGGDNRPSPYAMGKGQSVSAAFRVTSLVEPSDEPTRVVHRTLDAEAGKYFRLSDEVSQRCFLSVESISQQSHAQSLGITASHGASGSGGSGSGGSDDKLKNMNDSAAAMAIQHASSSGSVAGASAAAISQLEALFIVSWYCVVGKRECRGFNIIHASAARVLRRAMPFERSMAATMQRKMSTSLASLGGLTPTAKALPIVRVAFAVAHNVQHDFAKSRFCTVPVQVMLFNSSMTRTIELVLEGQRAFEPTHPGVLATAGSSLSNQQYNWSGNTRYRVKLPPMARVSRRLTFACTREGVYNCIRVRFHNGSAGGVRTERKASLAAGQVGGGARRSSRAHGTDHQVTVVNDLHNKALCYVVMPEQVLLTVSAAS